MNKKIRIICAACGISLLSLIVFFFCCYFSLNNLDKKFIDIIKKESGLKPKEWNEKFDKETDGQVSYGVLPIRNDPSFQPWIYLTDPAKDLDQAKSNFATGLSADRFVAPDVNNFFRFASLPLLEINRCKDLPRLGFIRSIGAWFAPNSFVAQHRKFSQFFKDNWEKLEDNELSAFLFEKRSLTLYKNEDLIKAITDKKEIKGTKQTFSFHPYALLYFFCELEPDIVENLLK